MFASLECEYVHTRRCWDRGRRRCGFFRAPGKAMPGEERLQTRPQGKGTRPSPNGRLQTLEGELGAPRLGTALLKFGWPTSPQAGAWRHHSGFGTASTAEAPSQFGKLSRCTSKSSGLLRSSAACKVKGKVSSTANQGMVCG